MKNLNMEVMERLLMDRAFGELDPDVSELLDACLESYPEYKALGTSLAGTIQLARQSMAALPESPPAGMVPHVANQAIRRYRRYAVVKQLLAAAALILVSFVTGVLVKPHFVPGQDASMDLVSTTESRAAPSRSSFWSRENLAPAESPRRNKPLSTPPSESHRLIPRSRHEN